MIDPFRVWSAVWLSIKLLWGHVVLAIVIAFVFSIISYFRARPDDNENVHNKLNYKQWIFDRFVALWAFCSLGIVLSYFLSLGISANSGINSALTILNAPLVSLVTAGIAFAESRDSNAPQAPRAGITAFLLTAIISYQTFFYQKTQIWG